MRSPLRRIAHGAIEEARSLGFDLLRVMGRRTLTVKTRQGRLSVDTADGTIGRDLFSRREYELRYVDKVLAELRRIGALPERGRGVVLDVGANVGVIAIGLLHRGEMERAIALEPGARNFELLARNVRQNGLDDRIVTLRAAASSENGTGTLFLSPSNFGDHRLGSPAVPDLADRATESVPTLTLDSLPDRVGTDLLDELALVWIDVQGHEGNVLAGGSELLSRPVPVVCEIWPHGLSQLGTSADDFSRMAEELWSSLWLVRRGRLVRYPISFLPTVFRELNDRWLYDNVLFL